MRNKTLVTTPVPVKFEPVSMEAIDRVCKKYGTNRSSLVRLAMRRLIKDLKAASSDEERAMILVGTGRQS